MWQEFFSAFFERLDDLLKREWIGIGDSDLDGAGAMFIFSELTEKVWQKEFSTLFVRRKQEGYGLSPVLVKKLKERDLSQTALFLFDCGTSDFKEIKELQEKGALVVVFDHHELIEEIPKELLFFNPVLLSEKLCTGQILYLLAKEIFRKEVAENIELVDLSSVATLAGVFDQVPLEGEAEHLFKEGFLALPYATLPALQAISEHCALVEFSYRELREKVIPLCSNALVQEDYSFELFEFFRAREKEKAFSFLRLWEARLENKKRLLSKEFERLKEQSFNGPFIFHEVPSVWSVSMMGTLASKLLSYFKKPSVCYMRVGDEILGSVRCPSFVNCVEWLKTAQPFLKEFGGHQMAAGFRLKAENLNEFIKLLNLFFAK